MTLFRSAVPKVAIRVDAIPEMGSGHLSRCITLADALNSTDTSVGFVCQNLQQVFIRAIREHGHEVCELPGETLQPRETSGHAGWFGVLGEVDSVATENSIADFGGADLLVVDHYGIDISWERDLRPHVGHIFVIDDLFDREHDCDMLLNQNLLSVNQARYVELTAVGTRHLLGPKYALLRPEFAAVRREIPRDDRPLGAVHRVNICFGGIDSPGATLRALESLQPWVEDGEFAVDVVIGEVCPHRAKVVEWAERYPHLEVHVSPANIAELLARADIGIGASGSMTWERACVGLPTIALSVAENQISIGEEAGRRGMLVYLGEYLAVSLHVIRTAFAEMLRDGGRRRNLSECSLGFVDGLGAKRTAQSLLEII